jgi:hypothetical protein
MDCEDDAVLARAAFEVLSPEEKANVRAASHRLDPHADHAHGDTHSDWSGADGGITHGDAHTDSGHGDSGQTW